MRLIDADALMKYPIRINHYDKENGNEDFVLGIESVLEYADNLPTVEAEPLRHGRWVSGEIITFGGRETAPLCCSECLKVAFGEQWTYCPNCGARMDGDDING